MARFNPRCTENPKQLLMQSKWDRFIFQRLIRYI